MVHFPSQVTGKAWKLSQPFLGPYKLLSLTPTNAEVQLLKDQPIFVSLSRVRPCYEETSDEIWAGHSNRTPRRPRKKVESPTRRYTMTRNWERSGPVTRAMA